MKRSGLVLGFLVLLFSVQEAKAVRGWVSLGGGAFYDENVQAGYAIGPSVGVLFKDYFFFGGRIESYIDASKENNKDPGITGAFDLQRFLVAVQAGGILPLRVVRPYLGGLLGWDLGWDIFYAMFDENRDIMRWNLGVVIGTDFFVVPRFSLGFEAEYHRVISNKNDIHRYVVIGTIKWHFGIDEQPEAETES